ncbi:uncharacterized protein LOC135081746 [Ostrinia nubilalis]|uniref:uncharacterized protein LOC135081746 n=1 Tax=Ostrinia nubilalis TaxID=29057 RepID=UPI00308230CF
MDEVDNLRKALNIVAKKLGIKEWRYQHKIANGDALNFLGNLKPVLLIDESTSEEYHLIIKLAPYLQGLESVIKFAYDKEVYVYATLFPIYRSLDTGIDYEKLFPKCYYGDSDNQLLVMEDMTTLGFFNYVGQYLDNDHINESLKAVARLHALSMILIEKKIHLPNYSFRPFVSSDPDFYFSVMTYCMQKHAPLFQNMSHYDLLVKLLNNFSNNMNYSSLKARKLVYGHGDCWKANVLFEYRNKKPVGACLVDYQLSRLMNPAQDVLYFIMTSTNSSMRDQKTVDSFLSTYYNELTNILQKNGLDSKIVYSEEDFQHDLKVVFPMCFNVAFVSFTMWLGLEDMNSLHFRTEKDILEDKRKEIESQLTKILWELLIDFKALGFLDE